MVHFAPEPFLRDYLETRFGDRYTPADLMENQADGVTRADMANMNAFFEPESLAGVIHTHVLEHVYSPIGAVVSGINSRIMNSGIHALQVPIADGYFRADYDPQLAPSERLERFGLEDHVCLFGDKDLGVQLLDHFDGSEDLRADVLLESMDAEAVAVRPRTLRTLNGHRPFIYRMRKST